MLWPTRMPQIDGCDCPKPLILPSGTIHYNELDQHYITRVLLLLLRVLKQKSQLDALVTFSAGSRSQKAPFDRLQSFFRYALTSCSCQVLVSLSNLWCDLAFESVLYFCLCSMFIFHSFCLALGKMREKMGDATKNSSY